MLLRVWGAGAGWGWGWAGLGWGWAVAGGLGLGCVVYLKMKRKLGYSKMERCVSPEKNELPHGQQQQAISIHFFLEGLL